MKQTWPFSMIFRESLRGETLQEAAAQCKNLPSLGRLGFVEQFCRDWIRRLGGSNDADFRFLLASTLREKEDYGEARNLLDTLVTENPANGLYLVELIKLMRDIHDPAAAELLSRAVAIGSQDANSAIALAEFLWTANEFDKAVTVLSKAVSANPGNQRLKEGFKRSKRRASPPLLLCCMPKSGTTFLHNAFVGGLDKPSLYGGSGGIFPQVLIGSYHLEDLRHIRGVYCTHMAALPPNLIELSHRTKRMVVHLRDPRQALLSWSHFAADVVFKNDPIQTIHYGMPSDYPSWPMSRRIDWQIENYLPTQIQWVRGWMDAAEDVKFETEILFTRQEDLKRYPEVFFRRILVFLEIDPDLFDFPPPARPGENNIRKGEIDEWRSVFSPDQALRATRMIPSDMSQMFDWPRD